MKRNKTKCIKNKINSVLIFFQVFFEKGYLNDLLWEKFNCIFNYGFNIGETKDFESGHKKQDKIKWSEDKRFQTMPVLSAIIESASRDM